jgi:hypothetical protein
MDSNLVAKEIVQDYLGEQEWNYIDWASNMRKVSPHDLKNLAGTDEGSELLDEDWLPLRDIDLILKGSLRKTEISIERLVWWYSVWDVAPFKSLRPTRIWRKAIRRALIGCPETHPEWAVFKEKAHSESWMTEELSGAIKTSRSVYWSRRKPTLWQKIKKNWSEFKRTRAIKKNQMFLDRVDGKRAKFKPAI